MGYTRLFSVHALGQCDNEINAALLWMNTFVTNQNNRYPSHVTDVVGKSLLLVMYWRFKNKSGYRGRSQEGLEGVAPKHSFSSFPPLRKIWLFFKNYNCFICGKWTYENHKFNENGEYGDAWMANGLVVRNSINTIDTVSIPFGIIESIHGIVTGIVTKNAKKIIII